MSSSSPGLELAENDRLSHEVGDRNHVGSSLSADLLVMASSCFPKQIGPRKNHEIPGPIGDCGEITIILESVRHLTFTHLFFDGELMVNDA